MGPVHQFFTILTLGVVGGMLYTVVTNPTGVKALFDGFNTAYGTAGNLTLGRAA